MTRVSNEQKHLHRIVMTVAAMAHADSEAMSPEKIQPIIAAILATLIRIVPPVRRAAV